MIGRIDETAVRTPKNKARRTGKLTPKNLDLLFGPAIDTFASYHQLSRLVAARAKGDRNVVKPGYPGVEGRKMAANAK